MAPTRFSIVLDNPVASYFPGQTVTGKVILAMDQEKNTQGVKLKFNGEAEVAWQESQGQSGAKGYRGEDTYFHIKLVLVGDEKGTDVSIPAGEHEYPFKILLPENIPSSFESRFGFVRYEMEAIVKRSWKFDYSTKIVLTVNALVDLNLSPVYAEPKEVVKEKSICCLCCKEGPIMMRVELPRSGYVPGESVRFSVHASNTSSRPVSAIVAYLTREISYRADARTKRISEEMVKERGPEVKPFESETWEGGVQIPPVPPSDLGGCKIIGITYLLKLKLDIPSSIDLKKKIPIIIGTIPFSNFLSDLHAPESPEAGSIPNEAPLLSLYPAIPPPVFQDSKVFGDENDGDSQAQPPSGTTTPLPGDAEFRFVPKYATYDYGWKFQLNIPDQNGLN